MIFVKCESGNVNPLRPTITLKFNLYAMGHSPLTWPLPCLSSNNSTLYSLSSSPSAPPVFPRTTNLIIDSATYTFSSLYLEFPSPYLHLIPSHHQDPVQCHLLKKILPNLSKISPLCSPTLCYFIHRTNHT